MRKALLCAVCAMGFAASANAAVIFSDDFESGNLNKWTSTAATPSPLVISNARNVVPLGGTYSAAQDTSADRMHHNIIADNGGVELGGPSTFTSWIYDSVIGGSTSTRMFNEVRGYTGTGLPNGGTAADGSLEQLLAIGKYNTNTAPGSTFNANKYQARVVTGTNAGWFNLDDAGSPNRSVGWHKFTIERLADGTTLNFYVDDILSKTFAGAAASTWDTVVMGSGLGTTATDSNTDGFEITNTLVPEPATLSLVGLGAVAALGRRRRA